MARTPGEIHLELAVNYADDPKVRALCGFPRARQARDLYVQMLCYCKRTLSDGWVPQEQLGLLVYPDSMSAGKKDVALLEHVELIECRDGAYYMPGAASIRSVRRGRYRAHIPRATRRLVYERDDNRCVYCGADDPLSLDHVKPYVDGGQDVPGNLVTACLPCNHSRGAGRW